MTKLVEWLTTAVLFLGPWLAVVTKKFENDFTRANFVPILLLPVVLVAVFGLVSVGIIAYRVYTFNDCEDAAKELQVQIKQAKEELSKKGMKFDS